MSTRHHLFPIGGGLFRISWTYDTKIHGSRLRWPRTITRITDTDGAAKFAKKWGLPWPNIPAQAAGGEGRIRTDGTV